MKQTKAISLGIMCLTTLLFFETRVVFAQSAQEIARSTFASTMLLVMEDANS